MIFLQHKVMNLPSNLFTGGCQMKFDIDGDTVEVSSRTYAQSFLMITSADTVVYVGATNIVHHYDGWCLHVYYVGVDLRRDINTLEDLQAYRSTLKTLLTDLPRERINGEHHILDLLSRKPCLIMKHLMGEYMDGCVSRTLMPGSSLAGCSLMARR